MISRSPSFFLLASTIPSHYEEMETERATKLMNTEYGHINIVIQYFGTSTPQVSSRASRNKAQQLVSVWTCSAFPNINVLKTPTSFQGRPTTTSSQRVVLVRNLAKVAHVSHIRICLETWKPLARDAAAAGQRCLHLLQAVVAEVAAEQRCGAEAEAEEVDECSLCIHIHNSQKKHDQGQYITKDKGSEEPSVASS